MKVARELLGLLKYEKRLRKELGYDCAIWLESRW